MSSKVVLSEVITDISAGPFGSNLKVACFVDKGFPIIDGANLKGYKVTDNLTKFVTEEKARSLHRSIAKRGEVVVTISGTLGQIAYIPDNSEYSEYLCSQRQFRVAFDPTRVYVPYLVFYFHTREGQGKILSFANQTGVPALAQPTKNFQNIEIDLPDLATQRRIANYGEILLKKIELNSQINDYLAELLDSLWIKACTEGRECLLSEVAVTLSGGTPKTNVPEYWKEGTIPFFSPKDVGNPYALETEKRVTELGVENCNSALYPVNTVFLTARGTVGKVSIAGVPMAMNQSCFAFYGIGIEQSAVYQVIKSAVRSLKAKANGATFAAINTRDLKIEEVTIPCEEGLERYQNVARGIHAFMLSNTKENLQLAELRDTLLPKLMSGEINVSKVDVMQLNNHLSGR